MEVVEVERHLFLVSALEVSSQFRIGIICLGEAAPCPLNRKTFGSLILSAVFGMEKNLLTLLQLNLSVV